MVRVPPGWEHAFHSPAQSMPERGVWFRPMPRQPINQFRGKISGVPLQPGQAQGLIPTKPSNFTVTATQGGSVATSMVMSVRVITGAAGVQNGSVASASLGSGATQVSITPTTNNSWVYAGFNSGGLGSFTPAANNTQEVNFAGTSNQIGITRSTSTLTGGTPFTAGTTAPSGGGQIVAAEVISAGTLAEDASSPPVVTTAGSGPITSAAFSPPSGSIVLVIVATGGSAGVSTLTLTNSGGLTFTQLVTANASLFGVHAIFVAFIPAATLLLTVGPTGIGNVWYPTQVTVSTTTGILDGSTFSLYLGPAGVPITLVGTLFPGGGGTLALALPPLTPGQYLIGVWTNGHAGDLASMNVLGTMDALVAT